jgi:hypothetical protein
MKRIRAYNFLLSCLLASGLKLPFRRKSFRTSPSDDTDIWLDGEGLNGAFYVENPEANQDVQPRLVYRFYGSPRSRDRASGSIPFLVFLPNVDHFKIVGQELAARGFNVLACERLRGENDEPVESENDLDNDVLIRQLLDALRWNRVVLVGCDNESSWAIKVALRLAPERVVGLVLCGNLQAANEVFLDQEMRNQVFAIDRFLNDRIPCPFEIVWDGDTSKKHTPLEDVSYLDHRYPVLGGGSAPHRRRPEFFAWVLTRFVEEQIAPSLSISSARGGQQYQQQRSSSMEWSQRLRDILSPFSFTVFGRTVAYSLFYITLIKVGFFQLDNIRDRVNSITMLRQRIMQSMQSVGKSIILKRDDEDSEDAGDITSTKVTEKEVADEILEEKVEQADESKKNEEEEVPRGDRQGEEAPETEPPPTMEEPQHEEQVEQPEEESPSDSDKDFRPFFFLDNVIA